MHTNACLYIYIFESICKSFMVYNEIIPIFRCIYNFSHSLFLSQSLCLSLYIYIYIWLNHKKISVFIIFSMNYFIMYYSQSIIYSQLFWITCRHLSIRFPEAFLSDFLENKKDRNRLMQGLVNMVNGVKYTSLNSLFFCVNLAECGLASSRTSTTFLQLMKKIFMHKLQWLGV